MRRFRVKGSWESFGLYRTRCGSIAVPMSHDRGSGNKGVCSSNEARQNVLTAAPSVNPTDSENYDFFKVCAANLDSSHSPACT
ncbi:hypothetical protein CBM2615_A280368 [Cupriavidus taiwanensis]|uniref:Uncharacterized protein n=1 Tax=Cupriavidus taiwanensis TaxID=164546 RepID=A0A375E119_9BURK|nr:hypothetical protein CBM2615_A280368 [Cupriavidus taiwanensis]SOZ57381.1 hypothetical protein CBM2614_A250372 [Cupriavidus taiwanensis]SOZ59758.1 hypothetical protein CBM2613_A250371 [Cupriavidus taiwanensis]SPA05847.1 hypothetical protein CBM2625_A200372 [Cupriavidus taiwanensis]